MTQKEAIPSETAIRPAPFFIGDDLALDFMNSVAAPAGNHFEWIATGEDLIAWLQAAKLITPDIASRVRSRSFPGELDMVAAEARALREWFRGFVLEHKGKTLITKDLTDLSHVNDLLARDETHLSLRVRPKGVDKDSSSPIVNSPFECVSERRWRTTSSLLIPLAETMARLVSTADFFLVKQCEGERCTLLMLDTTQRKARRWCTMSLCGNRAKQAAHRNRIKQKQQVS